MLEKPEPRMRFHDFGDSTLEYELLCWVRRPKRAGRARHGLLRGIDAALRADDIEIPYPKRDVAFSGGTLVGNGGPRSEPPTKSGLDPVTD